MKFTQNVVIVQVFQTQIQCVTGDGLAIFKTEKNHFSLPEEEKEEEESVSKNRLSERKKKKIK